MNSISTLSLIVVMGALSQIIVAQESAQPNVLVIIVDDLRPEIGIYGNEIVHTPHIDSLATTGVVFENAFTAVPVCGASRAAFLSGRKPTTARFLSFNTRLDEDLPTASTLPGYFRAHGYRTVSNGKVFDVTADSASSWSESAWNPSGDWTSSLSRNPRRDDLQRAYRDNPPGVTGPTFERLEVNDDQYPDGKVAEKTIDDLRRLQELGSPFFMMVGFRKPHLPFTAPDKYWSLYDAIDFSLPSTYHQTPDGVPSNPIHNSSELRAYAGVPAAGQLDETQALNLIHAYYAAVSYADAQVVKILSALTDLGLYDETVVVLLGDHGWNLGDHTMWNKHTLFDIALRTPLIIKAPSKASARVDAIVSLLDLFPTLVDLAGLSAPPDLDGVSLIPVLDNVADEVRTVAISRYFDGASARTRQFRYTDWRDEQGQVTARMLFDLNIDPDETRNVAEDGDYKKVVEELSALIIADESNQPWSPLLDRYIESRFTFSHSAAVE